MQATKGISIDLISVQIVGGTAMIRCRAYWETL
jgi:hypothetical protein